MLLVESIIYVFLTVLFTVQMQVDTFASVRQAPNPESYEL